MKIATEMLTYQIPGNLQGNIVETVCGVHGGGSLKQPPGHHSEDVGIDEGRAVDRRASQLPEASHLHWPLSASIDTAGARQSALLLKLATLLFLFLLSAQLVQSEEEDIRHPFVLLKLFRFLGIDPVWLLS